MNFIIAEAKIEGRPAFAPKIFLKLYFYGYLNGIRSSRRLINPVAMKATFKLFVAFLKDLDLVGGEVGIIKRQWGFNHTNLRGLKKVSGEMSLIMTVYNLKRVLNILGVGVAIIMEKLTTWKPEYPNPTQPKPTIFKAIFKPQFLPTKNGHLKIASPKIS